MKGMSYKRYLRIAADQIVERRKKCPHKGEYRYDPVFYFKCHDCGAYVPFRNPEDIKRRGIMPEVHVQLTHIHIEPEQPLV